jgi:gliding motility-associated lipoprotein GldH
MVTVIKKTKRIILILGVLSICTSCDSDRVFDKYTSLEKNSWLQDVPINFDFKIVDTTSRNNLYLNIRNNKDYRYSNLFVITHLIFPNGKKIVDTLQYEMANKNGKFLGTGISEIKHSRLFLKQNSIFPLSGKYKMLIWQAMRKNGSVNGIKKLTGITDVGFRIEKVN